MLTHIQCNKKSQFETTAKFYCLIIHICKYKDCLQDCVFERISDTRDEKMVLNFGSRNRISFLSHKIPGLPRFVYM